MVSISWIISILVLGVLVLVHELGHFVVARWAGVTVERFAIGFGPKVLGWTRGGTEYCLRLLPLGGYVKMAGEQRAEAVGKPGEFSGQPIGVRARIVAAGPIVNYLTSTLTLWVVLVAGYPELLPVVGRLVDGMPAQAAGLAPQDHIVSVDGSPTRTWDELSDKVHAAPGRTVNLEVERQGQHLTIPITTKPQEMSDPFGGRRMVGMVGIAPSGAFGTYRVSPAKAVSETFVKQRQWTQQMFLSLWSLFRGRVKFQESFTGPIGIIYMTAEATRLGITPLLYLVSILSLSLAIFNFFPVPILDGGHLFYLAVEKLKGSPISLKAQEWAARVSFALLLALFALVCVNDLSRFGLIKRLMGWWGAE